MYIKDEKLKTAYFFAEECFYFILIMLYLFIQ